MSFFCESDQELDEMLCALGGRQCLAGSIAFLGIREMPDVGLGFGEPSAQSREYELTFRTSAVAIAKDATVVYDIARAGGTQYRAREHPRQVDDGAFSVVALTKV